MPDLIQELREKLEKATAGPWEARIDWFDCADEGIVVSVETPKADGCFNSFPVDGTKFGYAADDDRNRKWTDEDAAKKSAAEAKARDSQEMRDARMVAAAINALPALLDVAAAAREAAAGWEGAMCVVSPPCGGCDACHLQIALAKLETP